MAEASRLRLESDAAEALVERGVGGAHLQELDERLAAVACDFATEIKAGRSVLARHQRAWVFAHKRREEVSATARTAGRLRGEFEVFVVVGVGGSDLAARVLHDTLDHPQYNLMTGEARGGAPEVHFTGDTFDPRQLLGLLDGLETRGLLRKTVFNVVSKSGTTPETLVATMVIRQALQRAGLDWRHHVVATTGMNEQSLLYRMHQRHAFRDLLPVPEGVGGRFSFASPVGLLLLGVTASGRRQTPHQRILAGLRGYEEAHRRLLLAPGDERNAAFRLARCLQVAEQFGGKRMLIFYDFADERMLGEWFVQLWAESLQERGGGMDVMATRGSTGNHSVLNGILRGARNKVVLFICWEDLGQDEVLSLGGIKELRPYRGLRLGQMQRASWQGTCEDFTANGVPNMTLTVRRRDESHLFALMRTLMDMVAVKGRLQGLHLNAAGRGELGRELTYRQDGVEGYKERSRRIATELPRGGCA